MKKTIKDIADPKQSNWENEAKIRRANPWMRQYSSQIARRIISVLNANPELTKTKLAAELGVSSQYISKVLKGRENLTLETIWKLSKALKTELISFPEYSYSRKEAEGNSYEVPATAWTKGKGMMHAPMVPTAEQGGSVMPVVEFDSAAKNVFEVSSSL